MAKLVQSRAEILYLLVLEWAAPFARLLASVVPAYPSCRLVEDKKHECHLDMLMSVARPFELDANIFVPEAFLAAPSILG
jgi:hypothetical protein